jgi:RimJ/RimL family protein N-acetyltransferase
LRHDLSVTGHAFRLRPVRLDDAQFIVDLRTDPERRAFIHPTSPDVKVQQNWLEKYFEREGDYYFIIERLSNGMPQREGTIGVYDVDRAGSSAEWGRWVVHPRSMAGLESAFLIYRACFEPPLSLSEVFARTAVANRTVIDFHDGSGLERVRLLPKFLNLEQGKTDAIEHRLTRQKWEEIKGNLEDKVRRVAQILTRGGK